ncbi:MAG TPA: hypothetical protein VGO47_14240, partial [Chlamydiales bacterium]|nr:hypothetical protein [Chlamydiales bacterium]
MSHRTLFIATCLSISVFSIQTITVGVSTDVDMQFGGLDGGTAATTDLRGALNHVNSFPMADGYLITFNNITNPIALGAMLPILNLVQGYPLTIDGGTGITIDGANTYRGFFAHQGPITLKNIHMQNLNGRGGNGGFPGGGGGMGAGAAVFVNNAQVVLTDVSVSSSISRGGNGGGESLMPIGSGGGGGLGGDGGGTEVMAQTGGGGGLGGEGASEVYGGGGGGINCGTNFT